MVNELNGSLDSMEKIKNIRPKLFACSENVEAYSTKTQTYSISDLGFSKSPYFAIQQSNWLNARVQNITKDSVTIEFFNPSGRIIAGTAGFVQFVLWEII